MAASAISPAVALWRAARRYGRLYRAIFRLNWSKFASFRANLPLTVVSAVLYIGSALAFFTVIFGHVERLGDWNRGQVFVFLGTWYLLDYLWMFLWFFNLLRVPELVRTGELDLILSRPTNSLFLTATRRIELNELAGLMLGAGVVVYGARDAGLPVTAGSVLFYVLLLLNGLLLFLGTTVFVTALTLSNSRVGPATELLDWFYSLADQPDAIDRGHLRTALTFALPAVVMASFPTRALFGLLSPGLVAWGSAAAFLWLTLAAWAWKRAVAQYQGAGG